MRSQPLTLSALIASILLLIAGNAFLMTLVGVRLTLEGVAAADIGWVLACYSVGFVVGTLCTNRFIERVGHIRTFAAFAGAAAGSALLYPLWINIMWWALLRFLSGVAMAALLIVLESWFSSRASNHNRAKLFASYLITFYLATAAGQILINVGNPASFKLFSIAALLLTLALIPIALTRLPAPSFEQAQAFKLFDLWNKTPLAFTASLVSGIVIGAFYAMAPVYAGMTGRSLAQLSVFMSISVIAAMLFAWPIGRICDRFERRKVLLWVALAAAMASAVIALVGSFSFFMLVLSACLFMGLAAALYPIAVAILNDRIDSHQIVAGSAGLLMAYGVGSCMGPVISALLMTLFGASAMFMGIAAALIPLVLLSRYWINHVEAIPISAQEHYVPSTPAATAVIVEIDPRNESFHFRDSKAGC